MSVNISADTIEIGDIVIFRKGYSNYEGVVKEIYKSYGRGEEHYKVVYKGRLPFLRYKRILSLSDISAFISMQKVMFDKASRNV